MSLDRIVIGRRQFKISAVGHSGDKEFIMRLIVDQTYTKHEAFNLVYGYVDSICRQETIVISHEVTKHDALSALVGHAANSDFPIHHILSCRPQYLSRYNNSTPKLRSRFTP